MHIHFEPNLAHQSAAIEAVIRVFVGAPRIQPEERLWDGEASRNVLHISKDSIKDNIRNVAQESGIDDYAKSDDLDASIEMETGTGKTYVYIRTIFQLYKDYGLHKFIIVVPSVAIREGVLKTLKDTKQHFREIYGEAASVIEYDSKRLPEVRSFCVANHLSIMVMNKQAFDSDKKIINDEGRDNGQVMGLIRQVSPIIILDEPQEGMDSENMINRLAAFNPLFKLRYSATHKRPKNVIHRLTPYDAYNGGLVKKVAVLSVHEANTQSHASMQFLKLNLSAGDPTASLLLQARLANGEIKEKRFTVKRLDDLQEKTRNPIYRDYVVGELGTTSLYGGCGYVQFTNGERVEEGQRVGGDKEAVFREQIRRTIQNHFQRKKKLAPLGIKPLALFFIDKVSNYTQSNGLIRSLFIEEYTALYAQEYGRPPVNIKDIHGGYFAEQKGTPTDSERFMANNKDIYDKILRDKTRLLSLGDPLEFIFSHSALGVGWDNPNVFTICTLNESISQIKKRQEIGRGLRLCVGQNGHRYRDPEGTPEGQEVNLLTVVANESYRTFVETYQQELWDDMGYQAKAGEIRDANKNPTIIRRQKDKFTSKDFQNLWARLKAKTRYRVTFREDTLKTKGIKALSQIRVDGAALEVHLTRWQTMDADGITARHEGAARTPTKGHAAALDIVEQLARDTGLATTTAAHILANLPPAQLDMLAKNPMHFLAEAKRRLRPIVHGEMVIAYTKTGQELPLEAFFPEEESTHRATTPTPHKGLYSHIMHDSKTVESTMARALDDGPAVRLFLKLPKAYKIPTPIGDYEPDFAIVLERRNLDAPNAPAKHYFVIETKGTSDMDKLRPDEQMKIRCAIQHFQALGLLRYLAPVDTPQTFNNKAGDTFLCPTT
ncbi:MAG: DEAD/DEAH box helicase family protein [Alphaproteobacteria bacterium]|jgi:type III restriction enzyme|nr:DEAD/DEAH box helicase family protein [Alphaproteobacteria bacterium]